MLATSHVCLCWSEEHPGRQKKKKKSIRVPLLTTADAAVRCSSSTCLGLCVRVCVCVCVCTRTWLSQPPGLLSILKRSAHAVKPACGCQQQQQKNGHSRSYATQSLLA